jgi:S-layer protein (TIGR01567 family)
MPRGIYLRSDIRWFAILLVMSFIAIPIHAVEIRGAVASADSTWNSQNFMGFYYDIEDDIGTETLSTTLWDNKLSGDSPYGVKYETTTQSKEFKFEDWGAFKVMGFLTERYFAGYVENRNDTEKNILFKESTDENSLRSEQLETILLDSKNEIIVTPNTPLKLAEGYELVIKYIDNSGMYLELTKNGEIVDSKIISPSKIDANMADKTYFYKTNVGRQNNLVLLAVHFKNALRIENQTVATVDGLWQLSETPIDVKGDTRYDKMTITSVDANAGTIILENKDNAIMLSKGLDVALMPDIRIKTANNDTLRYYIYTEETCE